MILEFATWADLLRFGRVRHLCGCIAKRLQFLVKQRDAAAVPRWMPIVLVRYEGVKSSVGSQQQAACSLEGSSLDIPVRFSFCTHLHFSLIIRPTIHSDECA